MQSSKNHSAPSLHELQRQFARAVYSKDAALALQVRRARGLSGQDQLAIYRSSVLGIQTDALRAVYPAVDNLVGSRFFEAIARRYIREHPSRSGDLHQYGDTFARFLENLEAASELIYLPDVARLEWLYHEVFHAPDCESISFNDLARIPAADYESLRFQLHPASRLIESRYPILAIWKMSCANAANRRTIDLSAYEQTYLLVLRHRQQVAIQVMDGAEFELLSKLRAGDTLGEAVACACGRQAGFDPLSALYRHISGGTFAGVRRGRSAAGVRGR